MISEEEKLYLIHSNVWRLPIVESNNGELYFIMFIDDSIENVCVYFLKNISEVFTTLRALNTMVRSRMDFMCSAYHSIMVENKQPWHLILLHGEQHQDRENYSTDITIEWCGKVDEMHTLWMREKHKTSCRSSKEILGWKWSIAYCVSHWTLGFLEKLKVRNKWT